MISIFSPVNMMVTCDQENEVIITINSPIRLIVGGRARLVRFAANHQKAISGSSVWSPRESNIMRLWVRS